LGLELARAGLALIVHAREAAIKAALAKPGRPGVRKIAEQFGFAAIPSSWRYLDSHDRPQRRRRRDRQRRRSQRRARYGATVS
jgi:hypothetical protein